MVSPSFKLPEWENSPLNQFLKRVLPAYVSPFNQRLSVQRLRGDLVPPKSHERVYQWLRTSKLTAENAQALLMLANNPENLGARGEQPLTIADFEPFVYKALPAA